MPSTHRTTWTLGVLSLYVALTLVWMRPLLPAITTAFPNDPGDPVLNAWILWWNARVVPFSEAWWNAPSFFPVTGSAALTELLVSLNLFASPVIWLSDNPVLAYNVVFLLSYPLAALAAYLLCLELTGHRSAAVLGGLAYGFAPYRMAQLAHLQVLASFWMPIALYGLHRYVRTRQKRWLVVFSVFWLLQALSNGYYLLYFSVLVGLWALWFLGRPREWRALAAVGVAFAAGAAPVLPVLLGYRSIHQRYGLTRSLDEILFYSGDVTSFLVPPPVSLVWGNWFRSLGRPEGELFPGLVIALLAIAGVVFVLRRKIAYRRVSRIRLLLGVVAAAALAVSVSFLVFGPWRVEIGGIRLLSVGRFHKPFSNFLVFGLAFVLSGPRFAAAFRERSAFAFYVVATLLIALAALGPEPRLMGEQIFYKPPYALLLPLPGFSGLRVPTRFWMLGTLCLAASGAMAFARLAPVESRRATVAAALLGVGIVLDAWPSRVPVAPAPPLIACAWPRPFAADAFLQLPLGRIDLDLAAMYRSAGRGLPSVNGYSGYFPPHYQPLSYALNRRAPHALGALSSFGTLEVAIDRADDPDGLWAAYVSGAPGARERPECAGSRIRLFELPASPSPPQPSITGRPIPIAAVTTDASTETAGFMLDGDLISRWEAGPQSQAHSVTIDLGAPAPVYAVQVSLGPYLFDFPRQLSIATSTDGTSWRPISEGPTDREALWGAIRDPREVPMVFDLGNVTARYIRLTQTGFDRVYYWSVAELAVFAPGARRDTPGHPEP
ncbi:MAG TPA: discoidin domain-containing protein [Vicinamibacterales bacterium]|nr:discoidin domain-containing protein [Vicinamibacterales bacterium]